MTKTLLSRYKQFDWPLLITALILTVIGLSTILSTVTANEVGNPVLVPRLINVQLLSLVIGLILLLILSSLNYHHFDLLAAGVYLVTILALVGVLFFGTQVRGSTRWFDLGYFSLQPSILGTILLILTFAAYFNWVGERINQFKFLILAILLMLAPVVLVSMQPDLGSAALIMGIWLILLHLTPVRLSRLLPFYVLVLVALPLGWFNLAGYQKQRILSFVNPAQDPLGSGYNLNQSMIAVGSGKIIGRGWGRGTQSHLQYLPEQHTDFIFATFAEEQGLIGSLVLIFLYGILLWRIVKILHETENYFGKLLCAGVFGWFTLHIMINIGMNLGLVPITGLPLPFMSYGGTALVAAVLGLGIVEAVAVSRGVVK